jgi:hypothetical protein
MATVAWLVVELPGRNEGGELEDSNRYLIDIGDLRLIYSKRPVPPWEKGSETSD